MRISRKRLAALLTFAALAALVPTALLAQVATSLDVADNEAFGPSIVVVPGASHGEAFYIVIHEGTEAGPAGVVGSSALLPAGSISDHRIQLNRAIVDGEHLWPMLHTDGNGNGVYDDPSTDPPVIDADAGNENANNIVVFGMQVSVAAAPVAPPAQDAPPAAADTGNAGLASASEGFGVTPWFALLAGTIVLVAAGGLATRRR